MGERPRSWGVAQAGLFGDSPYVRLDESRWDGESRTAHNLNWIIDSAAADVVRYGTTTHAYSDEEYTGLLQGAGFAHVEREASLSGDAGDANCVVLVATR
jgi:hypothetical protein